GPAPAPLRAKSEELHLHLPDRRRQPDRFARSEADARPVARTANPRVVPRRHSPGPDELPGADHGEPLRLPPLRPLRDGNLDAARRLNEIRREETRDPRLDAQIAAYELAFRMQTAAPELIDLSGETHATLTSYGNSDFARSLLLARRLVERGVRFVTVTHHE